MNARHRVIQHQSVINGSDKAIQPGQKYCLLMWYHWGWRRSSNRSEWKLRSLVRILMIFYSFFKEVIIWYSCSNWSVEEFDFVIHLIRYSFIRSHIIVILNPIGRPKIFIFHSTFKVSYYLGSNSWISIIELIICCLRILLHSLSPHTIWWFSSIRICIINASFLRHWRCRKFIQLISYKGRCPINLKRWEEKVHWYYCLCCNR